MEKPLLSSFSLDPAALEIAIDAGDEYCTHTAKPPRLAYAAAIRAYVREIASLESGDKICDACIDGLQADGETPCPCQVDDLPRQVRDLKRELSAIKEERDRYRRLLYLEAEDHDRTREAIKIERERCAKEAEDFAEAADAVAAGERKAIKRISTNAQAYMARNIAEAIRNGEQK